MRLISILKYWREVAIVLLIASVTFSINTCRKNDTKLTQAIAISTQNMQALKDSSINLKVTKEQLNLMDNRLYQAKVKIDSMTKQKSTDITLAHIVYVNRSEKVNTGIKYDSGSKTYIISYNAADSVKTFDGVLGVSLENNKVNVQADMLNHFKFNFDLIISKYIDKKTKITHTVIVPWYVSDAGVLLHPISSNTLKMSYRNAELLDTPFQENQPSVPSKPKRWGIGAVVGYGITINGLTPFLGIGLSYNILQF